MAVFGDTWFYIALIDARDTHHEEATRYSRTLKEAQVTTRWVLAELANFASSQSGHQAAAGLIRRLEVSRRVRIIEESDQLFEQGLGLYEQRSDKEWSLTDCISFVVMQREGLREFISLKRDSSQRLRAKSEIAS